MKMLHAVCFIDLAIHKLEYHFNDNSAATCHDYHAESPVVGSPANQELLKNVFDHQLFRQNGSLNLEAVSRNLRRLTIGEVLACRDVDHYNLLDKAVIYNSHELVEIILQDASRPRPRTSGWSNGAAGDRVGETSEGDFRGSKDADYQTLFSGTFHLASFLGEVEIVAAILRYVEEPGEMCRLRGGVRIGHVHGPPNHMFNKMNLLKPTFDGDDPAKAKRLYWATTHCEELPVTFAVCGDHVNVTRMLLSRDSLRGGASSGVPHDLIGVAWSCASYECLSFLLGIDPRALMIKNGNPWLVVGRGLGHGVEMIRFALDHGLDPILLNNLDGKSSTVNALHLFYNSLSKPDHIFSKYSQVYDVTKLLVKTGVDVNQETSVFRSHGCIDTPLHLLVDQINVTIQCTRAGLFAEQVGTVQRTFDKHILCAITLILDSGFDIRKHLGTLLERLFSNRNHLTGFKAVASLPGLSRDGYGFGNVYEAAKKLLRCGGRRESPSDWSMGNALLLTLVNNLETSVGMECFFWSEEYLHFFESCLQRLVESYRPNLNRLQCITDTSELSAHSPLIRFLDLVLAKRERGGSCIRIVESAPRHIQRIVSMFCEHHQFKRSCQTLMNGTPVEHGVFDSVVLKICHLQHHKEDAATTMKILGLISIELFQWGVTPEAKAYVDHITTLQGPLGVRHTLLCQMLLLGLSDVIRPKGELILGEESYQYLLEICLNEAHHQTFYDCLRYANSIVLQFWSNRFCSTKKNGILAREFTCTLRELAHSARPLKQICRLVVVESLRTNLCCRVKELPVPLPIAHFLVSFLK